MVQTLWRAGVSRTHCPTWHQTSWNAHAQTGRDTETWHVRYRRSLLKKHVLEKHRHNVWVLTSLRHRSLEGSTTMMYKIKTNQMVCYKNLSLTIWIWIVVARQVTSVFAYALKLVPYLPVLRAWYHTCLCLKLPCQHHFACLKQRTQCSSRPFFKVYLKPDQNPFVRAILGRGTKQCGNTSE